MKTSRPYVPFIAALLAMALSYGLMYAQEDKSRYIFVWWDKGVEEEGPVERPEIDVFVKPVNLPENYRKMPPINAGETWWLGSPEDVWEVKCLSVEKVGGVFTERFFKKSFGDQSGLVVKLSSPVPIKGEHWLLSRTPLPKQTWSQRQIKAPANTVRIILTTEKGEFRLDSIYLPDNPANKNEGDQPSDVRVNIYRKVGKTWKKINSFMTESEVGPELDVDGDGVPEILSSEGYQNGILRKFYPEIIVIAIDRSGV